MANLSEAKTLSQSLYEVLAEDAGWKQSPAHDGWISDDYQDNPDEGTDGYEVANAAEDVCFCYDVAGGDEASKLAAAAERYAERLDALIAAAKRVFEWSDRQPAQSIARIPQDAENALRDAIAKAEGRHVGN